MTVEVETPQAGPTPAQGASASGAGPEGHDGPPTPRDRPPGAPPAPAGRAASVSLLERLFPAGVPSRMLAQRRAAEKAQAARKGR